MVGRSARHASFGGDPMADEEKAPAEPQEAPMKISRRDFLVGAGAGVVATGAAAAGYTALQQPKIVEVVKEVLVEVPVASAPASKQRNTLSRTSTRSPITDARTA